MPNLNLTPLRIMAPAMILACFTLAPSARAENLHIMLAHMLASNPQLRAAETNMIAAAQTPRQAYAALLPQINAQATYSWREDETTSPFDSEMPNKPLTSKRDSNPSTVGVTLSQYVFAGGRVMSGLGEANEFYNAAREGFLNARQSIMLGALTIYFDVLRDEAILRSNQGNVELIHERLLLARRRAEVGELTRTDVAQAEARYSLAQAQLAASRSALATSQTAFRRIFGIEPKDLAFPPLPNIPTTRDNALLGTLARHPQLAAARATANQAAYAARGAFSAFMPSVTLQGEYTYAEETNPAFEDSTSASITAVLTVPLFSGGQRSAQLAAANAQARGAYYQLIDARRAIEENLENSWTRFEAATARLHFAQEQERATQVAFDSVRREAELGARTTLDTLDAAQELLDARVSHQESRRDQQVAAYALIAAAGLLTPGYLNLAPALDTTIDAGE